MARPCHSNAFTLLACRFSFVDLIGSIMMSTPFCLLCGTLVDEEVSELSSEEVRALLPTFGLRMIVCRPARVCVCVCKLVVTIVGMQDETFPVDCVYVGNGNPSSNFCAFLTCLKQ